MRSSFIVSLFLILWTGAVWAQPTTSPVAGQSADGTAGDAKKEVKSEETISKIQSFLQPFEYDREQVRDPFETQSSNAPLQPGQVYGPFLQMQNFRLNDLKLKGLLWRTKDPVAIFKAPDGKDHRLTIKDYIGENFGYIATIREKEVVVIQTIEENNRRYSTTKVVFLDKPEK